MKKDYYELWIKAAIIRAIKTFAQTLAGGITVGAALNEISWFYIGSVASVAAIYSICTSVAGLPEVKIDDTKEAGGA